MLVKAFVLVAAALALVQAAGVDLQHGAVLRAPDGAEYVIGEELSYSPRLKHARALAAAAAEADTGSALLQLNKARAKQLKAKALSAAQKPEDYVVGAKIGQGGFGAIFKATKKSGDKAEVAIKVQTAKDAHELDRLKAEYDVQQKLVSVCPKSIVRVFEHWEEYPPRHKAYRMFMVMELMGGDLDHHVEARSKAGSRADVPSTLPYWHQMIDGIACMHNHGYVHRDIKGGNFLVSAAAGTDGVYTVKVSDFGETRNGPQLRHDFQERHMVPYPHQTVVFNAPTAVKLGAQGTTTWEFVPPIERTWAKRLSWDGYALGLSLLSVYYAADFADMAQRSIHPKLTGTSSAHYLRLFAEAFHNEMSYDAFALGLDEKFHLSARMPDAMRDVARDLLLEKTLPANINTAVAPFEKVVWATKPVEHAHELTPSAPTTTPASPASPSPTLPSSTATRHSSKETLSAQVASIVAGKTLAPVHSAGWAPRSAWFSTPKP